jgi:tRNA-dihydrouridine synthase A
VKSRIGIDHSDSYEELLTFVRALDAVHCKVLIVHARKAWLEGLSPRENREIPPLRYDVVEQLKRDFPHVTIVINGGITSLRDARGFLRKLDGVMLGRVAYNEPYLLAAVDREIFGCADAPRDRFGIFDSYLEYAESELDAGTPLRSLAKPLHYLFQGEPGARQWRRHLSERCNSNSAGIASLRAALHCVERANYDVVHVKRDAAA